jgi:hypothetical protein
VQDQTVELLDELNKYTLIEFIELEEEERSLYKAFGLRLKGSSCCRPSDILDWPWGEIKQLQDIINQDSLSYDDMIDILSIASQNSRDKILSLFWNDAFALYNFVTDGIKKINELEQQLRYEPTARESNAGIDQYNDFGWFCTLDRLAGGDPLKYDEIGKLPFHLIFAKLKLNNLDAEFNRRINKI